MNYNRVLHFIFMGLMVIISFKKLLKTKTGKEFIQVRGQMREMQYELFYISYQKLLKKM